MPTPTPHDTELYTLGSGIMYVDAWSGSTPPAFPPTTDVGNVVEFTLEPTQEVLEHYSTRSKTHKKDKIAVLRTGGTGTITLDEVGVLNFQKFDKGDQSLCV